MLDNRSPPFLQPLVRLSPELFLSHSVETTVSFSGMRYNSLAKNCNTLTVI
jgi:hypothetical protein